MKYRTYETSVVDLIEFSDLNLDEDFFISLREDYKPGFDKWFIKKQENKDFAFVYRDLSSQLVEAFLYLKLENEDENYENLITGFSPKKRLKVGTFKITNVGKKMGEKFMQIICDHAILNDVNEIYITIFENDGDKNKEFLINLIKKFNFQFHSIKKDTKESVFTKTLEINSSLTSHQLYPLINEQNDVYLIPIASNYHSELLPECYVKTEDAGIFKKNQIVKNSIKKIYIGNNLYAENPKENDIIIFMRLKPKEDLQSAGYRTVLTGIGLIIKKSKVSDYKKVDLLNLSAISKDVLDKNYLNGEVLEFLFIDHFSIRPVLNDLRKLSICPYDGGVRGLIKISKDNFKKIIEIANYKINKRS